MPAAGAAHARGRRHGGRFRAACGADGGMAVAPDAVRRGTVLLVRLPRDKARPAVVVRSDLLAELSYATVLPITTELRADATMRIDIEPGQENGLRAASQV